MERIAPPIAQPGVNTWWNEEITAEVEIDVPNPLYLSVDDYGKHSIHCMAYDECQYTDMLEALDILRARCRTALDNFRGTSDGELTEAEKKIESLEWQLDQACKTLAAR